MILKSKPSTIEPNLSPEKTRAAAYFTPSDVPAHVTDLEDAWIWNKRYTDIDRNTSSGTFRCTGSALDACNYNWRANIGAYGYEADAAIGGDAAGLDAWNLKNAALESGAGTLYYDKTRDGPLTEEIISGIPLSSLIGLKDARGSYGVDKNNPVPLSRHTVANVGYDPEGNAQFYSLGNELSHKKLLNEPVNYIVRPNPDKFDWDYVSLTAAKAADSGNDAQAAVDVKAYLQELQKDGTSLTPSFTRKLVRFDEEIQNSKNDIQRETGINNAGYARLHKLALALAVQETGNANVLERTADAVFGDSNGVTQIKESNVDALDDRYGHIKLKHSDMEDFSILNAKKAGVQTMLLLIDNAKRYDKMKAVTTGSGSIREFDKTKAEELIETASLKLYGKSITTVLNNLGILSTTANVANKLIPKVVDSDNDYFYSTRKTEGNKKNLTDDELGAYMWNNPARISTGDAQGRDYNNYVSNVLRYLQYLNK